MPQPECQNRCPLCGEDNRCGMQTGDSPCWCADRTISRDVLARIPTAAVGRACVCQQCVESEQRADSKGADEAIGPAGSAEPAAPRVKDDYVPSPCTGVCRLEPTSRTCIGCLRTADEIAVWATLAGDARRDLLDRLRERSVPGA